MSRIPQIAVLVLVLTVAVSALGQPPPPFAPPPATDNSTRLPINLPTALQMAQAKPVEVALASWRLQAAYAQQQKAKSLWLPTLYSGLDYARHDGQIQDIVGNVFGTSRQSMMFGVGPSAVINLSDAVHAPLAARQVVAAREAGVQIAMNDSMFAVAEAYFNVQQARGDVAGGLEALTQAEELLRRAEKLAPGVSPPSEASRARTEMFRRKQALISAHERWRIASAELTRLLRLQADAVVDPIEPPSLDITLVDVTRTNDDLIEIALTHRPELAAHQALIQAALQRWKQEKQRPLLPTVAVRGNATNPAGALSSGPFAGGRNGDMSTFGMRNSFDVQVLWDLQGLGLGNRANTRERQAEQQQAILELVRAQDRVSAEVVQAHAQAKAAAERVVESREGLKFAKETMGQSLDGMQMRRVGEVNVLFVRPAEVVAAVQGLAQAYADFHAAVADNNRAQFRLYRALGQPAQCLNVEIEPKPAVPAPTPVAPAKPPKPLPKPMVPATAPATVPTSSPKPPVLDDGPEWRPAPKR